MSLNICMDCKFEKKRCQCNIEPVVLQEDNMVKKIVKWIWKIICWPFKKAHQWLTNSLPK